MYADDTLLHCCGTDLVVVQEQFQQDVDRVQGWMQSNKFQLNVDKSALMLISSCQKLKDHSVSILIGGRPLPRVISTEYLGVINDQHLTWQCHILKKIHTELFGLYRLKPLPNSLFWPPFIVDTFYQFLIIAILSGVLSQQFFLNL